MLCLVEAKVVKKQQCLQCSQYAGLLACVLDYIRTPWVSSSDRGGKQRSTGYGLEIPMCVPSLEYIADSLSTYCWTAVAS